MRRTYLALAGLTLAGATLPAALPEIGRAAGVFGSRSVDASRFAVLARPVGITDWNLLILEQLQASPACWRQRPDGLVDPTLNRFDHTRICARYLDSNGFSLRVGGEDLGVTYRLRLQPVGGELHLQALSPAREGVLTVARAPLPRRDPDAFVALTLQPGWELQRRTFGERSLGHIYLANDSTLAQLSGGTALPLPPPPPPVLAGPSSIRPPLGSSPLRQPLDRRAIASRPARPLSPLEAALQGVAASDGSVRTAPATGERLRAGRALAEAAPADQPLPLAVDSQGSSEPDPMLASGRVVALPVIPFGQ